MGDSAEYEIFVRPDAVERALLILADHADLPARAPTTVRLPCRNCPGPRAPARPIR